MCQEDIKFVLPADVYQPSTTAAIRTLIHATFLCVLGSYVITVSPSYLWWAGALVSGCAMSWLYIVGWDCAQRSFLRWRWANHLVGVLCTLLMLRPFSSLRLTSARMAEAAAENIHSAASASASASSKKKASSTKSSNGNSNASGLQRAFQCFNFQELKTLYAEGDWRRNLMPIIDLSTVCIFAAIFFPLMLYYTGVVGLVKYWLVPFVDMHVRIGTFANVLTRVPYLALFHPEIKPMLPVGVQKAMRFPSYNVNKAHRHISSKVSGVPETGIFSALLAPINSIAFGRVSRDTPVIAYAVGVVIAASAIYHRTFASVLLIPTIFYIAWALPARNAALKFLGLDFDSEEGYALRVDPATLPNRQLKPHWFNRIYLGMCHVICIYAFYHLFFYFNYKTILLALATYHFAAMGITAGSHRYWAHRGYNASPSMRFLMMLMNLFTNQGSIFKWVRDHRLHHKHVDTDEDPHNSNRGFWWSHCGWLMYQKPVEVLAAGKNVYMDDIYADEFVMWQTRNYKWAAPLCCFGAPAAVAYLWGDALGGFAIAGALRYCVTLHCTWFVNSIAHMWGYRPYIPNILPAENLFVAIVADGEGWHNFHHAFPYDYSTNEYGVLQYNPTTLFINIMAFFGFVTDRRKAVIPDRAGKGIPDANLPEFTQVDMDTCAKQCACILAIDGWVYDLTGFEDHHPAGAQILKDWYGKDATKAFHGEVHKHTEVALNQMKVYKIAKFVK